ncbi:hypothetical protein BHM03_00010295 [Ensete ventricosum]|nr:hypothetical protein BHM03_00010295 [Ensete ventricosum]
MFVNGLGDRCYFNCEDIDSGVKIFEEYTSSRPPVAELYVSLIEGAMVGYTPRGMQLAQEYLVFDSTNTSGPFSCLHGYFQEREIPSDDPRLLLVARTYDNLNLRFGGRRNA